MNSFEKHFNRLGENYFTMVHKTGLTIVLYPMFETKQTTAIFGTKFGSIDNMFKLDFEDDYSKVPDGSAHYLEHKLFENENGVNSLFLLSEKGAIVNAGTFFDRTSYFFSCTENFNELLKILLNFVQNPYFTSESIEKERGIISQEIKMYEDSVKDRVFLNCRESLYFNNPIKLEIGGSLESIQDIDEKVLLRCYDVFYNLCNMFLVIAGNFDMESVCETIFASLKKTTPVKINRSFLKESFSIVKNRVECWLPVAKSYFCIGYKLKPKEPGTFLKFSVIYGMIFELLIGTASDLFSKLRDEKVFLSKYPEIESLFGNGYSFVMVSGESEKYDRIFTLLNEEIEQRKKIGFELENFEALKKSIYGKLVCCAFDSPFELADLIFDSLIMGAKNPCEILDIVANLKFEELTEALFELEIDKSVISIGLPKK